MCRLHPSTTHHVLPPSRFLPLLYKFGYGCSIFSPRFALLQYFMIFLPLHYVSRNFVCFCSSISSRSNSFTLSAPAATSMPPLEILGVWSLVSTSRPPFRTLRAFRDLHRRRTSPCISQVARPRVSILLRNLSLLVITLWWDAWYWSLTGYRAIRSQHIQCYQSALSVVLVRLLSLASLGTGMQESFCPTVYICTNFSAWAPAPE